MYELSKVPTKQMKVRAGNKETLYDEDGNEAGSKDFYKYVEYDPASYTKVFHDNVREFYPLKESSFKVFFYMTKLLKPHKLEFTFYRDECAKEVGISETTIYRALAELIQYDFIAKTKRDEKFFINPTLWFNGDRVRFIKEFRPIMKKRGNKDVQLEGQQKLPV